MENQENKSQTDQTNDQSTQGNQPSAQDESQNSTIPQYQGENNNTEPVNVNTEPVNVNSDSQNTVPEQNNNQPQQDSSQNQPQPQAQQNDVKEEKKIDFDTYTPSLDGNNNQTKDIDDNEEKSSKVGTIITAILIVVIAYGIWSTNKNTNPEVAGDGDKNTDISIVVDDTDKKGEVKVEEEVKKEEENNSKELGEKIKITAYYSKNSDDCSEVLPLEREIEKKYKSNIVNTIRGLLTVLDEKESNQGWSTNIPIGTYLKYINIKSGVAEISLTSSLDTTAGSCAVTAVRSQIEKTLTQFPYISSVNICVEENCNQDEILQP
jgi:hypothetical protein